MVLIKKAFQAGLQSSTIMSLADISTQWLIEGKGDIGSIDGYRTFRWTLAGLLLHGPYFFVGFRTVDSYFQSQKAVVTLRIVAQKTAIAQFILFPPYLVGLFGFMGKLEGHPDIKSKIQTKVPEAFVSGCIYWPIANGINFALVSPSMRVPYLAASAGLWNSYLSWENARDTTDKKRKNNLNS